jgi:hypothetical protein
MEKDAILLFCPGHHSRDKVTYMTFGTFQMHTAFSLDEHSPGVPVPGGGERRGEQLWSAPSAASHRHTYGQRCPEPCAFAHRLVDT